MKSNGSPTGYDENNRYLKGNRITHDSATTYKGKLYVLVGRWIGSMGEGIAIGFDGMKRVTIIGTKMAGLLGAISGFRMSETKIGYQFPTEKLYHIDGTPREDFAPGILTQNIEETTQKARKIE